MIEELQQLGFTKNTATIYLILQNSPVKLKAGEIIKQSNLQRSAVYSSLDELINRKLITKVESNGISAYSANDVSFLIEEKNSILQQTKKIVSKIQKGKNLKEREVLIYEGDDVTKRIASISINSDKKETVYFMGSARYGIQKNMEDYWRQYHEQRIKKGIPCKILYDNDVPNTILDLRNSIKLCEAKYLPFGLHSPLWFNIFDDYVSIVIPSEEPAFAFVIRSKKTAEALKMYFEYLWTVSDNKKLIHKRN